MHKQIHMFLRNGIWYFRRRVPKDLLQHYSPKKEFTLSLNTKDRKRADVLAREESVKLDREIEYVRQNLSNPFIETISPADIKKLTDAWIAHILEEDEESRVEGLSDKQYDKLSDTLGIVDAGGKHAFAKGEASLVEYEMMDFCESHGFNISKGSNAYDRLAYAFLRTSVDAINKLKLRHQGEIVDTPKAPSLSQIKQSSNTDMDSLEALRNYWLTQGNKSRTSIAEAKTMIAKFKTLVGDLKPSEITKAHIVELKDKMLEAKSSPATINKGRGILAAIFSTAEKNAKIESNPFLGMEKLKVPRKEADSLFTIAELQQIFNSPIYKQGFRPKMGKGEAAYWIPLLGLYTGCRINEAAQLFINDIGSEDGIHYLMIRPDEATGRTVKDSNKRRIPLHNDLVKMGFLDYVKATKDAGHIQLFPLLRTTRKDGKIGDAWASWWRGYVRNNLKITRVPQPFHAFRHSFTEHGRKCGIDYEARMRIEGHSMGTVGDKSYGNVLFPLEPLYQAISKLNYKGLDLSHLIQD